MDRGEFGGHGSHISARKAMSGIEVSIYLSPADWRELTNSGSVDVSQSEEQAPADAPVVRVTIYQH